MEKGIPPTQPEMDVSPLEISPSNYPEFLQYVLDQFINYYSRGDALMINTPPVTRRTIRENIRTYGKTLRSLLTQFKSYLQEIEHVQSRAISEAIMRYLAWAELVSEISEETLRQIFNYYGYVIERRWNKEESEAALRNIVTSLAAEKPDIMRMILFNRGYTSNLTTDNSPSTTAFMLDTELIEQDGVE